jgi:hypothetical protein
VCGPKQTATYCDLTEFKGAYDPLSICISFSGSCLEIRHSVGRSGGKVHNYPASRARKQYAHAAKLRRACRRCLIHAAPEKVGKVGIPHSACLRIT